LRRLVESTRWGQKLNAKYIEYFDYICQLWGVTCVPLRTSVTRLLIGPFMYAATQHTQVRAI